MSYRDDSYEYHRRRDEFNREMDRQRDYQREDFEYERRQRERDREMGWEAARRSDTFNAIGGLAGPEWALRYHELSQDSRYDDEAPSLPNPKLTFRALHFYEAGDAGVERSQRVYRSFFPQSETRYIFFEVSCTSNREYLEHKHKMVAKIRYPDRSVKDVEWEATSEFGWEESWHTHGWGWSTAGNWEPGVYCVDILIDDQNVGQAFFGIYQDKDKETELPRFGQFSPKLDLKLDTDLLKYLRQFPED